MDTIKAPQESVEAYLYNEFNIDIYDELTESEDWKGLFEPLDFFNLLYNEFEYFETNAGRYLEIKEHFGSLALKDQQRHYVLWALQELIRESYRSCEGVIARSCNFIYELHDESINKLYPEEIKEEPINEYGYERAKDSKYDFNMAKEHLETLPDTKQKIKYLIEVKTEYEQQDNGFVFDFRPTFDKQCELEIEKIEDLMALEAAASVQEKETPEPQFKLADKRGAKTDLIRVLDALYELRYIETSNGQIPNKADFMRHAGAFFGVDLSKYDSDLSQAFNNASLEANLKVFEEMKKVTQSRHLGREQQ